MPKLLAYAACFGLSVLLSACSTQPHTYHLNHDHQSISQDSRVRHIVLHYTASPFKEALKTLTQGEVSSHYLISDEAQPVVYQLVDEHRRAWHAGLSKWFDQPDINTSSLGIELVNAGRLDQNNWASYSTEQIKVLIALLNNLVKKHNIASHNIVAHSDIAPQRKIDPGPLFPWEQLAQAGLGRWFDPATAQHFHDYYEAEGLPSAQETQLLLYNLGYPIATDGVWDQSSTRVLQAFQMHYRPTLYNGVLDTETASLLRALQPH